MKLKDGEMEYKFYKPSLTVLQRVPSGMTPTGAMTFRICKVTPQSATSENVSCSDLFNLSGGADWSKPKVS